MKIYFFWPFIDKDKPTSGSTESYEFYNALIKIDNIILTNKFEEADYIFYMMELRNCLKMPWHNVKELDMELINKMNESKNPEKDIIIDYNDWTDTRNVPENKLSLIGKYFKRSVIKKENSVSKELIKYSREIIPISYGIRNDFIQYDKIFKFEKYNYDICCLFNGGGGFRSIIPNIVNKYKGPKYIGNVYCSNRYGSVNREYFKILKTSKIIVTANPPNWEGDFRLWEALLMGNLVLCDKMIVPSIMKYPLEDKKHLVYYSTEQELVSLINYYINNEEERQKIGNEGREYSLKYHKFSDRVKEVINHLK
jgi:hypothetical protein